MVTRKSLPLIIAHRGDSKYAPENTIAAFQRAVDAGADGIEFDVRLSKDGVPVVIHDNKLERVANIKGRVAEFSAAELKKIDVGSWFNSKFPKFSDKNFSEEKIPTLREVLELLKNYDGLIYIELKSKDRDVENLVKAVCNEIKSSPLLPNIIVKSFRLQVIPEVRHYCSKAKTAALFAPKIMAILRKEKHLFLLASEFGAEAISLHYSLVTRKFAKTAEKLNIPLTIWTADNPLWINRAIKLGIKAIITNNPARMLEKRRRILHKNSIVN